MATSFDDLLTGSEGPDFLQGLSGNDTLQALSGNDLLYGGADTDLLEGNDGIDQLYGGSGKDVLYAGAGNDKLDGGSGDDQLFGEDGADNLIGGDGDDTVDGGFGANTLHGGAGNDDISFVTDGATPNLIFGDDGNDTIIDFFLAPFPGRIAGTSGGGVIDGGAGDDRIYEFDLHALPFGSPTLTIYGGDGNDTLAGVSHTAIYGGTGDDFVVLERYVENQVFDEVDWFKPADGGTGHDVFILNSAYQGPGADWQGVSLPLDWTKVTGFEEIVLRSIFSPNFVAEKVVLSDANIGETGNLTVRTADVLTMPTDDFQDVNLMWAAWAALMNVDGSSITTGHLTLTGQGTLIGGDLSDTIIGTVDPHRALQGTIMSGNGGDDVISGWGTLSGGAGNDMLTGTNAAGIFDGGTGDDTIVAGSGNDSILGGDGNDSITAGGGTNTISGGAGDDTIDGGTGTDTVLYSGAMADYTITDAFGTLTVTGPDGTDSLTGINFIQFSNQLYEVPIPGVIRIGTGDPDYIDGSDGNDSLSGGAGNDTLTAGLGNDTLAGGTGSDSIDGGSGIDLASYTDAASGVLVDLTKGIAAGGDATLFRLAAGTSAKDRLSGIENVTGSLYADSLTGNTGDNALDGASGNDSLSGGGGRDALLGGAGNDILLGGLGNDTLDGQDGLDTLLGGAGNDTYVITKIGDVIFETTSQSLLTDAGGVDTVLSALSFSLATGPGLQFVENLRLTGSENKNATGNDLGNVLTGNDGVNKLYGGAGADTLSGGLAYDEVTGGAGKDVFLFNASLSERDFDRIQDFELGSDRIWLENAVFVDLAAGRLKPAGFAANTTGLAETAADRVIYETDTGRLFYDADGTGTAAGVHFGTLAAGLALSNLDFLVV